MRSSAALPIELIKGELKRLRQGQALAHPQVVLRLSDELLLSLAGGDMKSRRESDTVVTVVSALQEAVDRLASHERLHALVDFNLAGEHSYPTLTARQESLASSLRCTAKTVRRHADKALDTLALILVAGDGFAVAGNQRLPEPASSDATAPVGVGMRGFWRLSPAARVDLVCSEIPSEERPYYASPTDRNYLRYAKFADLDSLIYVRTRLAYTAPMVTIRDFSPSEYYDTDTNCVIVIGGPPWNAKYREFLPQLPFYFEPHPLGEDDPLVIPQLNNLHMGPRWTARNELVEDLAVFARLTLGTGTTVFLLGGCLTLGVLGAAMCFLDGKQGAANADYVTQHVGDGDFVLVTEVQRVGGITDVPALTRSGPLLLLGRTKPGPYELVVDNTARRPVQCPA